MTATMDVLNESNAAALETLRLLSIPPVVHALRLDMVTGRVFALTTSHDAAEHCEHCPQWRRYYVARKG